MNAGAYGFEIKDILEEVTAINKQGVLRDFSVSELKYSYRNLGIGADLIFISGLFNGSPASVSKIAARMRDIQEERSITQPVKTPTGGSTFKNPPGHKAWELIDAAGCRGLSRGDAIVSIKHCNFLINKGSATANDLERLGEDIRHRVFENCGIRLEWEIQRIGTETENKPQELRA